jgi:hypothetical protein
MDFFSFLASTNQNSNHSELIITAQTFWQQIASLGLREALVLIAFGAVCIFYGWRIFRVLVVITCAVIGMVLGMRFGIRFGSQVWGGVLGLLLFGIIAFPFTKWAVSIMGALAGGFVTAGIWYACGLPNDLIWAGALMGVIAGGMISFIIFKISVMLFTCLAGITMLIIGVFALFNLYPPSSQTIHDLVLGHRWFMPVALILPTMGCMFLQNKLIKDGSSFSLDAGK